MLYVKKIVQGLAEGDAKQFLFQLEQKKSQKCVQLFCLLRDGQMSESEIAEALQVKPSYYYSIKSKLNKKIQEYFAINVPEAEIDLLRNISNIPNLLFNSPREVAVTHLLKLEEELKKYDMPHALTTVYISLMKLSRYSPKYFEYSQLYNKHQAYTMTIDKANMLLSDFNKLLGEYVMSRNKDQIVQLQLIQKELHNCTQLYNSHRLTLLSNILDAQFALFGKEGKIQQRLDNVDSILLQADTVIESYKKDETYCHLSTVIAFLWFEFYHQLGMTTKANTYFSKINDRLTSFLLLNFCCFPTAFLISKAEKYLANGEAEKLAEESRSLAVLYTPDTDDVPGYINYIKFRAIAEFNVKNINQTAHLLNDLINRISFKYFLLAEFEIKLFLVVCYLLSGKIEMANTLLKKIHRKLLEIDYFSYKNVRACDKLLTYIIDQRSKLNKNKIKELFNNFMESNSGPDKILTYVDPEKVLIAPLLNGEKVIMK